MLPIGLIAVIQTQSVSSTARANAGLALLALTQQAATDERLAMVQALGGADALAVVLPELYDDVALCSIYLRRFVERSSLLSFAGVVAADGRMDCSSTGQSLDFDGSDVFADALANPRRQVTVNPEAPISGTSVIIASTPVMANDGSLAGFVSLSIPHDRIVRSGFPGQDRLRELVTFNADGELLTATGDIAAAARLLPTGLDLARLAQSANPEAMRADDAQGVPRIFTVAPIEPGAIYVMGIWDEDAGLTGPTARNRLAVLIPVIMWGVSLLVSLFAIHRLVTRHLQRLGRQMAVFAAVRRLPDEPAGEDPPTEIRRMQEAFSQMTEALVRDEASLENAVREKSVLVKEIHHRVKNNLQLISSIIALQIRDADSAEAKAVLRQTQDRVLSMATIHRDLYQTSETGLVDVGHLMREVVSKSLAVSPEYEGIDLEMEIEDVWLYPDQAVPMSLLAAEAVINALKHMLPPDEAALSGVGRWMRVVFRRDPEGACHFSLVNAAPDAAPEQPKGMGRKLIRAFATQLNAAVRSRREAGRYTLSVDFEASEFAPAPGVF